MKLKTAYSLIISLILTVGYLPTTTAVTDAELEALEKQIEQLESEEKKQAEAAEKKKADVEKKRLSELEKQRQEKLRFLEEEKNKLEQEKWKLEEARQTELDRKRQEKEAKQFALEEQKSKEEEAAKARVTIVFYRNQGYVGGGSTASIFHNSDNIGGLINETFFIYSSPPGTQTFTAEITGLGTFNVEKTFDFKPSQTYYISYNFTFDATLQLVPNIDGRAAIIGIKNVGKINPADVLNDYDESEAYKEPPTQQQTPL